MNFIKLKQEIDQGKIIVLEQKDMYKFVQFLDSKAIIPWIYNFYTNFKIYKKNDDYIVVINKRRN